MEKRIPLVLSVTEPGFCLRPSSIGHWRHPANATEPKIDQPQLDALAAIWLVSPSLRSTDAAQVAQWDEAFHCALVTAVIDLFSRQVVGWCMSEHMQASVVVDALRMAWFRRRPAPGLIFHSDRGSQYCGHDFQQALKGYEIKSSMSRKGDCWDKAPGHG